MKKIYILLAFMSLFIYKNSFAQCTDSFTVQNIVTPFGNDSTKFNPITNITTNAVYSWTFYNTASFGSTYSALRNPQVKYPDYCSTKYKVCLTITDTVTGCSATYCDSIMPIQASLVSNFNIVQDANLVNVTSTSTGSPTSFMWYFGDGATATGITASHTYTGAYGKDSIALTVKRGSCIKTVKKFMFTMCQTDFDYTVTSAGLTNKLVLDAKSNRPLTSMNTIAWNIGSGLWSSSNLTDSLILTASNTYNVCLNLVDVNGCASKVCKQIDAFVTGINPVSTTSNSMQIIPTLISNSFDLIYQTSDAKANECAITVKDINGKIISTESQSLTGSGIYTFNFDTNTFSNGIYFVTLSNNSNYSNTQKIVVAK